MKSTYKRIVKTECNCGREPRDLKDLASILEFHHKTYFGSKSVFRGKTGDFCEVVCLRKGCKGRWRSKEKYTQKLPLIMLDEYNRSRTENLAIKEIRFVDRR